ncbi:MAG: hypothetical protein IJ054_00370 [Lachnospiraceae bacterium]|nr:hypothetical protein [Lachnospiraceae bacterium]
MKYDYEFNVKDLFQNANRMADYVRTNPDGYRNFLAIAARCEHFTPSNQLLIHGFGEGKIPEYLDDYSNWINKGFSINDNATIIHVMENDNKSQTGYIDRMLVDVSDTNAVWHKNEYDKGIVLEALMTSSPCRIEFNPELTSKAVYIPNRQVIEVSRGYKNIEQIFENLSREMVHARLHLEMLSANKDTPDNIEVSYPRNRNNFKAYSVSYMLASKYNMAPEQIEMSSLPSEWSNLSDIHLSRNKSQDGVAAKIFRNDVIADINKSFRTMDSVLNEKILSMYSQTGSEL